MKFRLYYLILLLLFSIGSIEAVTPNKIKTLYTSLEPNSLSQHLAFYALYPASPEGKLALQQIQRLLSPSYSTKTCLSLLPSTIQTLLELVHKLPNQATLCLSLTQLQEMEKLAEWLPHRQLKGHWVESETEVLALATEEIDLARGLLLSQLANDSQKMALIRSYEAQLDLMALQILTKIKLDSSAEQKIEAINCFIFDELHYRFPPHSLYAKEIALYTFLPSVLDSRKGVCLGVSILYLSLAQRLNLSLDIVTPPGHIFIRYQDRQQVINVETTARGIHLDSEEYLSIETHQLPIRSLKEVIGLAHFNEASVYWQKENYEQALQAYQHALPYLPHDKLLQELMAYNYLFIGQSEEARPLLEAVKDHIPAYAIYKQTVAEDFLKGAVDSQGIKPLFMHVDETRESILKKRLALEQVVEKFPLFRAGIFSLAVTWLQLHRLGEALSLLKKYHQLDSQDPTVEYYLAALYKERLDYTLAWQHLLQAEKIVATCQYRPKALRELRKSLCRLTPE